MTFKLPSLKGKSNADKPLVCHGLTLFQWGNLREKEEPIGRGSFGLVFVARNGHGEWNIFQGKYLLFEQYSDFTTFCLFEFVVIFRRSVAFRIYLALSAQRDGVTSWHNLSLCSTVICKSYTRIGSRNLKDNKFLTTTKEMIILHE